MKDDHSSGAPDAFSKWLLHEFLPDTSCFAAPDCLAARGDGGKLDRKFLSQTHAIVRVPACGLLLRCRWAVWAMPSRTPGEGENSSVTTHPRERSCSTSGKSRVCSPGFFSQVHVSIDNPPLNSCVAAAGRDAPHEPHRSLMLPVGCLWGNKHLSGAGREWQHVGNCYSVWSCSVHGTGLLEQTLVQHEGSRELQPLRAASGDGDLSASFSEACPCISARPRGFGTPAAHPAPSAAPLPSLWCSDRLGRSGEGRTAASD